MRERQGGRGGIGAAAVLAALIGAAPASTADLVDDGARPDVFLLYTGDVIGHLDPCG